MTTVTPRRLDLKRLVLAKGAHSPAKLDNGQVDAGAACLLEAVAFMAGEPWSDTPECVSPVLGAFGRNLNDVLPDDLRQQLVPLIPKLIGTRDDRDERRSYIALDWLIRTYLPTWLRLVPALAERADAIAGLPEIVDLETARAAGKLVLAARSAAYSAAYSAAVLAAYSAADLAARSAAYSAARSAAYSAADLAARSAAYSAARSAAYSAADLAARSAAYSALAPTVTELQQSAISCFGRMIEVSA